MSTSQTHLVLIPSYNPGRIVIETVKSALAVWQPVWVIVDGSTDSSDLWLQELEATSPMLRVIVLPTNMGKGNAVAHGLALAQAAHYTHVLTMDSDGQHPAEHIATLMSKSMQFPKRMILGRPVFDSNAPSLRVHGRKISNAWANLETLWMGIGDSLYGFRVYPVAPLLSIMKNQRWMRRFDFDIEAVVRLCWRGVWPMNINTPVRYLSVQDGGVSHFNYYRDNALLTWMHARLCFGFAIRLPFLLIQRFKGPDPE